LKGGDCGIVEDIVSEFPEFTKGKRWRTSVSWPRLELGM